MNENTPRPINFIDQPSPMTAEPPTTCTTIMEASSQIDIRWKSEDTARQAAQEKNQTKRSLTVEDKANDISQNKKRKISTDAHQARDKFSFPSASANTSSCACTFCRKKGHTESTCRIKLGLCLRCGGNHAIKTCPRSRTTNEAETANPVAKANTTTKGKSQVEAKVFEMDKQELDDEAAVVKENSACQFCRKKGHTESTCRKKLGLCLRCGGDHMLKECSRSDTRNKADTANPVAKANTTAKGKSQVEAKVFEMDTQDLDDEAAVVKENGACAFCRKKGHTESTCRKKLGLCLACGGDHMLKECSRSDATNKAETANPVAKANTTAKGKAQVEAKVFAMDKQDLDDEAAVVKENNACTFCRKKGHAESTCRKKLGLCHACGGDHMLKNCPRNDATNKAETANPVGKANTTAKRKSQVEAKVFAMDKKDLDDEAAVVKANSACTFCKKKGHTESTCWNKAGVCSLCGGHHMLKNCKRGGATNKAVTENSVAKGNTTSNEKSQVEAKVSAMDEQLLDDETTVVKVPVMAEDSEIKKAPTFDFLKEIPHLLCLWNTNVTKLLRTEVDEIIDRPDIHLGRLRSLTQITPRPDLLVALVRHWDSNHAVFRFGECELTPTVEEIAYFFDLPYLNRPLLFPKAMSLRALKNFFAIKHHNRTFKDEDQGCSLQYLFDRYGDDGGYALCLSGGAVSFSEIKWRELRYDVLMIAILSLLVFPTKDGEVRFCFIRALLDLRNAPTGHQGFTIAPMILGEIFRALTFCQSGKWDYFAACSLFLECWAMEHFNYKIRQINIGFLPLDRILTHHKRVESFEMVDNWDNYMDALTKDKVQWLLVFHHFEPPIYLSGTRHTIILLGLTGLAAYIPLRVFRQFGLKQHIPPAPDPDWPNYWADFVGFDTPQFEQAKLCWSSIRQYEGPYGIKDVRFAPREDRTYAFYVARFLSGRSKRPPVLTDGFRASDHIDKKEYLQSRLDLLGSAWSKTEHQLTSQNEALRKQLEDVTSIYSDLADHCHSILHHVVLLRSQGPSMIDLDYKEYVSQLLDDCMELGPLTCSCDESEDDQSQDSNPNC